MKYPQYLVRPSDYAIWELDPSNSCYRSYKGPKYSDGTTPNAPDHYTYDLLQRYGFFQINENEIPAYEAKFSYHYAFLSWQHRNDGHGGCKGGTEEEYEEYLKREAQYQLRLKQAGLTGPAKPLEEYLTGIDEELNKHKKKVKKEQEYSRKILSLSDYVVYEHDKDNNKFKIIRENKGYKYKPKYVLSYQNTCVFSRYDDILFVGSDDIIFFDTILGKITVKNTR